MLGSAPSVVWSRYRLSGVFKTSRPPCTRSKSSRGIRLCAGVDVDEWDVVVYKSPMKGQTGYRLGRVSFVLEGQLDIDPLVEESAGIWVLDSGSPTESIPSSDIISCMEHEYGQRIEQDRISNPHGEHAEEVWEILDSLPDLKEEELPGHQ